MLSRTNLWRVDQNIFEFHEKFEKVRDLSFRMLYSGVEIAGIWLTHHWKDLILYFYKNIKADNSHERLGKKLSLAK